jgi:hypothetical protein
MDADAIRGGMRGAGGKDRSKFKLLSLILVFEVSLAVVVSLSVVEIMGMMAACNFIRAFKSSTDSPFGGGAGGGCTRSSLTDGDKDDPSDEVSSCFGTAVDDVSL